MTRISVKVFTLPNCPTCPAAKKLVKDVAKDYDIEYEEIDLEKDMISGLQYGVASTPSIAVGENVISRGDIPSKEDLIEQIEKTMRANG